MNAGGASAPATEPKQERAASPRSAGAWVYPGRGPMPTLARHLPRKEDALPSLAMERISPKSLAQMRRELAPAGAALARSLTGRVRRWLSPVYRSGVVRVFGWDLQGLALAEPSPPSSLELREVTAAELVSSAREFGLAAGEIHRRLRLGDRCFGALVGGRPVHVRWIATRPVEVPELDAFACPGPAEVVAYASNTLAAFRAQRASTAARQSMERTLFSEGYRRAFAHRVADVSASAGAARAPQRLLFEVPFFRVLGGRARLAGELRPPLYALEALPAPALRQAERARAG